MSASPRAAQPPTPTHLRAVPAVADSGRRIRSIDELLAEVRTRIDRCEPVAATERVAAGLPVHRGADPLP